MRKTVLVRGPALTQSGYGEHTRFVLRSLRLQEEHLDIHVMPVNWGETGWLSVDDEERRWIETRVEACKNHMNARLPYDISVQVTIPNEWQRMAAVNIGVTAGIETNKVAPIWLQKANEMDKVITISEHSKKGFTNVVYNGHNPATGQPVELRCTTPVEVAHYPVKTHQAPETPILELDYDFNFLAIAQWGPRKNVANLIKWFVEENMDQEVGLVLKTSIRNNSYVDREHMEQLVRSCVPDIPERKCKVYLLHGDLTEAEMHSLYIHPKIKAMVSLAHGEGFGLPLFEAAYSGLPIIAPGWSGQTDFLYAPFESKSKKNKGKEVLKPLFAEVEFTMGPVPQEAVWQGVIEPDMAWCYPTEGSFKLRMRQVRNGYDKWLEKAQRLQEWVREEFEWGKKHQELIGSVNGRQIGTPEPVTGISFCISTNGAKPEKTETEIRSIHKTMSEVNIPYEIIVAGNTKPFQSLNIVPVHTPEDAENGLLAKLRNNAGQVSKFDVILFVDDDFIFPQEWASKFLEYSKNNSWDVTANRILLPDGSRFWDRATMQPHKLVDYDYPSYSKNLYQTGGFWIMRRKVYNEHNWNSTIPINADRQGGVNEDIEMSLRMHLAGIQLSFDKENIVWHDDNSYTEYGEATLKKDYINNNFGIDLNFLENSVDFEKMMKTLC